MFSPLTRAGSWTMFAPASETLNLIEDDFDA